MYSCSGGVFSHTLYTMHQKIREGCTLTLIALLPFHALLVTVGTKMLAGANNAPLTLLAVWKEGLLALILLLGCVEVVRRKRISLDVLDWLIIILVLVSLVLGFLQGQLLSHGFLYGMKYDFIPLLAFFVLRRVAWSPWCLHLIPRVLIGVGVIVSFFGLLTLYLPQEFFSFLGYSDLHSLYQPDAPLAAFQKIGGTDLRRLQSTMSGPNQLGVWLLLPLSILLTQKKKYGCIVITLAILLTFSRSAWIAAFVIGIVYLFSVLPRAQFLRMGGGLAVLFVVGMVVGTLVAPEVVARFPSTKEHFKRPLEAMAIMEHHPFGLGLGSAGPASNHKSETCVYIAANEDVSWAEERPNLCVFAGERQVQPLTRTCQCPLLPENWYLQIGVELGIIGFLLYLLLIGFVMRALHTKVCHTNYIHCIENVIQTSVLLSFIGIAIASLFLHAWEDAAVAYTLWILIASLLQDTRVPS